MLIKVNRTIGNTSRQFQNADISDRRMICFSDTSDTTNMIQLDTCFKLNAVNLQPFMHSKGAEYTVVQG